MSDIIFFLYVTKLLNLLNPHTLKDKTFNNINNINDINNNYL